ncbi:hypothetical protein BK781_19990 [Bacillus thuringiensis serovar aizawai]|nr:hypothetical protein BK781_19990 [Bacillus thuringiensis serovar aizawai]
MIHINELKVKSRYSIVAYISKSNSALILQILEIEKDAKASKASKASKALKTVVWNIKGFIGEKARHYSLIHQYTLIACDTKYRTKRGGHK